MPIPRPSYLNVDVRTLVDLLASCPIDDVVLFDEMSEAIGSRVTERRYLIDKAMKVVNSECGALFGNVRGMGYKRLPGAEAHKVGHAVRRKVRGASRRASATITNAIASTNDLSPEAGRKAYAEINVLGLINHISGDGMVVKASTNSKPEPVAKVMKAFLQAIGG